MQKARDKIGKFSIEVELANYGDLIEVERGHLEPEKVRRLTVLGVVDSGAARLVLPVEAAEKLGLTSTEKVKVRYADRRTATRPVVEGVYLKLLGRHSVFKATLEPKRDTAFIGALVLEDLDLLIDCLKQKLYPRDPKYVIAEIE